MSCQRSQVAVKVRTTTSTSPFFSASIRPADVTTLNCTLFGSPKMAAAISWTRSMSKPSSAPVVGLRKPKRNVFWSTPATSWPRSWMALIVEPAGIWPAGGSAPSGR